VEVSDGGSRTEDEDCLGQEAERCNARGGQSPSFLGRQLNRTKPYALTQTDCHGLVIGKKDLEIKGEAPLAADRRENLLRRAAA
jgi:hypothetical protein